MDPDQISEHLLSRAQWSASRSSGPGGQHRDKASTRAELVLTADDLADLERALAARLERGLGLAESPLRITVQDERSLVRNQELAAERLRARVRQALAPAAPPRRPTRPSRTARRKRVDAKTRRGSLKRLRGTPSDD
jgi:ribosome-associated protein